MQTDAQTLQVLASRYGTPLWVYDAAVIRSQVARLKGFDTIRYAQKANGNLHLLRLMRELGVSVDAVSSGELERAQRAGYELRQGDRQDVVFTADAFSGDSLERVVLNGIAVNAGSLEMLEQLGSISPGHGVWLRVNPGFGHGHHQKTNTGGPGSKHGIWHEHVADALRIIDHYRMPLLGLHMHIGSGADMLHLGRVCDAMLNVGLALKRPVPAISAGGGISTSGPVSNAADVDTYAGQWRRVADKLESYYGTRPRIEIEPGRFLVGPAGLLLTRVCATKATPDHHFAIVDAGMSELIRPALYGSAHRIDVVRNNAGPIGAVRPTIVAGPLCESGDVFTQADGGHLAPIELEPLASGDLMAIHDVGAYGSAMSSNYNSRPLAAEVLLDGSEVRLIRCRQNMDDMLCLELNT